MPWIIEDSIEFSLMLGLRRLISFGSSI